MTPLCKLLASYDSESSKDWSKKVALNELKSLKEEIFIKAGKSLIIFQSLLQFFQDNLYC